MLTPLLQSYYSWTSPLHLRKSFFFFSFSFSLFNYFIFLFQLLPATWIQVQLDICIYMSVQHKIKSKITHCSINPSIALHHYVLHLELIRLSVSLVKFIINASNPPRLITLMVGDHFPISQINPCLINASIFTLSSYQVHAHIYNRPCLT